MSEADQQSKLMADATATGDDYLIRLARLADEASTVTNGRAGALWESFYEDVSSPSLLAEGAERYEPVYRAAMGVLTNTRGFKTEAVKLTRQVDDIVSRQRNQRQVDELERLINLRANVADVLEDCSPPEDICPGVYLRRLRMPASYEMSARGVFKLRNVNGQMERKRICSAPMFMVGRALDEQSGVASRQVVWLGPDRWHSRIVPRSRCVTIRGLNELIDYDAPLNGDNLMQMSKFLAAFDTANAQQMHAVRNTGQMGWQADGSFLVGHDHFGGSVNAPLLVSPPEGMESMPTGWEASGTWEGWLDAVRIVQDQPLAMIALAASIASPLLHIVNHPGFTIDFAGETTGGKTTCLRLAASVWGKPSDTFPSAMYSWASSQVWIERANGFVNSLPLCLDDTKKARNPKIPRDVAFEHHNGQGRGRGTISGTQSTVHWRNIIISTGEAGIVDHHTDGGLRARVITVRGKPLGHRPQEGATMAEMLSEEIGQHHGWLGRKLVEYLVSNSDEWGSFRSMFVRMRTDYGKSAPNAVARRHAGNLAVLDMAIRIMKLLGVTVACKVDPVLYLQKAAIAAGKDADQPLVAMQQVFSWSAANQFLFFGRHAVGPDGEPKVHRGWAGAWAEGRDWQFLAFLPDVLKNVLSRHGHTPAEIITRWAERGWFDMRAGSVSATAQVAVSIQGVQVPCYLFSREMYDSVLDPSGGDEALRSKLPETLVRKMDEQTREAGPVPPRGRPVKEKPPVSKPKRGAGSARHATQWEAAPYDPA